MAKFNMCGVNLMLSTIIVILAKGLAQSYQEVFVNDYVSMRCSPNGSIDIQWHHNTDLTYVYAGGRLRHPYDQRFQIKKYETTGEYDLIIPNVTLQDAGWYYCSGEISGIRISSTQLTVLHVSPACSSNVSPRGFVGPNTCGLQKENMTFTCDVTFNGRAPYVIWRSAYDSSQPFCSSSCEVKSNRSICNLTLRADPLYDGSVFICDAITSTGRRFSCNSEMIKVWYLSTDYQIEKKKLHESSTCAVTSNLKVQYNWALKENNERTFLSANQTISFQQSGIHQCEVNYRIGNSTCFALVKNVTVGAEDKEQSNQRMVILFSTIAVVAIVVAIVLIVTLLFKQRHHQTVRMDSSLTAKEKSAIDNNRETLLTLIDADGLIDLLKENRVFDEAQLNKISSKSTSREKNGALLKILENGKLRFYWKTIECLHQSKQSHVAEILETGGFSVECLPVDIGENEPFSRDVYIGYSPKHKETVDALITQLRNNGINCYLPSPVFDDQSSILLPSSDPDKHAWIQKGVSTSTKCLLLWPLKYVKEEWYGMEKAAVLRKVEIFGRDTLIIVKSKSEQKVPKGFKGFKEIVLKKEQSDTRRVITNLVTEIKKEPRGIMKFGLADGYFYGYLNIILKDFRKRLTEKDMSEPPGIEAPVSADCLPNTLKKLLIVVPESCICPPSMAVDKKIEFHKVVKFKVDRAGKKRDYANSLFKVKVGKEDYYFAGEFIASISTLYDTYMEKAKAEPKEMTEEQLYEERNVFFYSLKTILNQPKNAALKDQVKLVYWSDPKSKNTESIDLHQCILRVLKKEFGYPMYKRPRGKCLIINTVHSKQGVVALYEERGPQKDTDILKKLFQDLHFEVSTDVDSLVQMKESDHSSYEAFVCCILSHGKSEEIFTSEGKQMRILDVAKQFAGNHCLSLGGKPKMFFIQTYQSGESDAAHSDSSPSASDFVTVVEPEKVPLLEAHVDRPTRSPMPVEYSRFLSEFPDFLMSFSCIPGYAVCRNAESASCYIQALDECLRQENEINLALDEVTTKVREELLKARTGFKGADFDEQLPIHLRSTTIRRIYL